MKVGFIGLGNAGGKLAGSLLRNGYDLTVRDLNPEFVADFVSRGAKEASFAPLETKSATNSGFRSLTVKSYPFLNKLPANFPPALPKPINPTFIAKPPSAF